MKFSRNIRQLKILALLCAIMFLAQPCLAETKHIRRSGNNWLLVIGIDQYVSWPPLKTATNDARAVRKILKDRYIFEDEHIIELYDEDATRKNILNTLVKLAKTLTKNDNLMIFYAGHGQLDEITGVGSWVPVESGTDDPSAWISNYDIKNYLNINAIKAKHIFLVSDSCFSGDFFHGTRGKLPSIDDIVVKKAFRLDSRQALTSGGVEPVTDAGFGGNSVFSYFFVKALAENDKPFMTASELYPSIKAGVAQNAAQFPQFGALYGVGGQDGGEYVFFLKDENRIEILEENEKSRKAELLKLKRMKKDADRQKNKEQLLIDKKEAEIADLDAEIEEMRAKVGSSDAGTDILKNMLSMVRQKETQARRLKELKERQEREEERRRHEIEKLRYEQQLSDLKDFEEIARSDFGKEMVDKAWQSLAAKYPDAKHLKVGDTRGFRETVLRIKTYTDKLTGTEFVMVKGGCFSMGDSFGEGEPDEQPVHEVCIGDIYLGKYEVTQEAWEMVMEENPSKYVRGGNYPVDQVSWDDIQTFINRLNLVSGEKYRLPTEAEWEYAARSGGVSQRYAGLSETNDLAEYANVCDASCQYDWRDVFLNDGHREVAPIGSFKANEVGLHDMTGNVWEWCSDVYHDIYYTYSPRNNPKGVNGTGRRVFRGGSWSNESIGGRATNRVGFPQNKSAFDLGFRLAIDPK